MGKSLKNQKYPEIIEKRFNFNTKETYNILRSFSKCTYVR